MKHLGDITKIHNAPFVDCITFGSPCQDLSIAGKRAGLDGERSGLFMDAVRIIKEMREQSGGIYPTFAIWENVPGAFSSNGGKDFRAVLEELASAAEGRRVAIPEPPKGKWRKAGYIEGDRWSIAWRTFDAQFWGVPQRRKRIALVVDFGGQRAGEILFERTGVRWNLEPSIPPWQGVARNPAHCTAGHDQAAGGAGAYTLKIRSGCEGGGKGPLVQTEKSATLSTLQDQTLFVKKAYGICSMGSHSMMSDNPHSGFYEADTSRCLDANGGNPSCNQGSIVIIEGNGSRPSHRGDGYKESEIMYTLNATEQHGVCCAGFTAGQGAGGIVLNNQGGACAVFENHSRDVRYTGPLDIAPTVTATYGTGGNNQPFVVESRNACESVTLEGESVTGTLMARDYKGVGRVDTLSRIVALNRDTQWIVRRLTPTECERLQGFPDGWTDIGEWTDTKGKKHRPADSPRYKALGNSIALPQWWWITCKMAAYMPAGATLGSLFDGIGGFPLVWETRHGTGTALWASEIEEFPMAVTKARFGDD